MRLFADAKRGTRIDANSPINAEAAERGREVIINHGLASQARH
jgi:hypothetical protein